MVNDSVPTRIWSWLWAELEGVSDEIRTVRRGRWLLAYEGWGGCCVEGVWDPKRSDEENEEAAYAFAVDQSEVVIREWQADFAGYELVESGHDPTALYGVTWALFRRRERSAGRPEALSEGIRIAGTT